MHLLVHSRVSEQNNQYPLLYFLLKMSIDVFYKMYQPSDEETKERI